MDILRKVKQFLHKHNLTSIVDENDTELTYVWRPAIVQKRDDDILFKEYDKKSLEFVNTYILREDQIANFSHLDNRELVNIKLIQVGKGVYDYISPNFDEKQLVDRKIDYLFVDAQPR